MPVASRARPIGVTENSDQVCIWCSAGSALLEVRIRSFSRINGLEPTMVMVPPRMAQKPIGMSRRDIGSPVRAEMRLTTGRKSAAAPTFCMKLEMKPTEPEMAGMMRASVRPATFRMVPASLPMRPVLSRPAPMIMTAMMEMTALLEKPRNSSEDGTSGFSKPARLPNWLIRPSSTMMLTAATSTPTTSKANRKIVSSRIAITTAISPLGTTKATAMPAMVKRAAAMSVFRGSPDMLANPCRMESGFRQGHRARGRLSTIAPTLATHGRNSRAISPAVFFIRK